MELSNKISAPGDLVQGVPAAGGLLRLQSVSGSAQVTVVGSEITSGASINRKISLGPWVAELDFNGCTGCRVTVDDMSSGSTVSGIWSWPGQDKGRLVPRLEAVTAGVAVTAPNGAEKLLLSVADPNVAISHPLPAIALAGVALAAFVELPVLGRSYTFSVGQVITWYCRTL